MHKSVPLKGKDGNASSLQLLIVHVRYLITRCYLHVLHGCSLLLHNILWIHLSLKYSDSNSIVFVNAPYFDCWTHGIRGADGLSWWSPNQVLVTICCVCSVEVCACVYCFCLVLERSMLHNDVIFYQLSLPTLQVIVYSCMPHRPCEVPLCQRLYQFEK